MTWAGTESRWVRDAYLVRLHDDPSVTGLPASCAVPVIWWSAAAYSSASR